MGLFSNIFGAKTKTKSTSSSRQQVTPTMLPEFQGLAGPLAQKALEELNKDPSQLVAGLSESERAGIAGLKKLTGDKTFDDRITAALGQATGRSQGLINSEAAQAALLSGGPQVDVSDYMLRPDQIGALEGARDVSSGTVSTLPQNRQQYGAERVQTRGIAGDDIEARMNPYINNVLDPALERLDIQQGVDRARSSAQRAGQKAFGWGGQKAAALEQYLQGLQRDETTGALLKGGFESAQGLALSDEERALRGALGNQSTSLGEQGLLQGADTNTANIKSAEARANQAAALEAQRANQAADISMREMQLRRSMANQSAGLTAGSSNLNAALQSRTSNQDAALQGNQAAGALGNAQQGTAIQGAQTAGTLAGQAQGNNLALVQGQMGVGATERDIAQRTLQAPSTQLANTASILFGSPMGQEGTASGEGTGSSTSTPSLFDVGSGVARAVMGGGFAEGGLVDDEDEDGTPALSRRQPFGEIRANLSENWNGPTAVDQQVEPALPERASFREISQNLASNNGREEGLGQPVGLADNYQPIGNIEVEAPALGPPIEVGYAPQPTPLRQPAPALSYRQSSVMPARPEPSPSASPARDLMASTMSALAENATPKKRFVDRIGDWLNKDSTIEGFAMFSPGWRDLRDSQAEGRKIEAAQSALTLDAETKAAELALKGRELKLKYPQGGGFSGDGIEAQIYNQMMAYNTKKMQGAPTTPQEDMAYQLGWSKLSKPQYTMMADGSQIMAPGMDLSGFVPPRGGSGGAALGPYSVSQRPMESTQAGKLTDLDMAADDLDYVKTTLFDMTDPEKPKIRRAQALGASIPGSQLFNEDADRFQAARQAVSRVVDLVLRARTGAQAPQSEIDHYTEMYAPNVTDGDFSANRKMQAMQKWFETNRRYMSEGINAESSFASPGGVAPGGGGPEIIDFNSLPKRQ